MSQKRAIAEIFRRGLAALLAILLSAQVAMAFVSIDSPPPEGYVRSVVCGPDGFQTITINLETGEAEITPAEMVQDRCPFCVIGVAMLATEYHPPERVVTFHFVPSEFATEQANLAFRLHRKQAARAPPVFL